MQAELFILRLSRNSGVLGLAGMAFISQLFPTHSHCCLEGNQGILLVRPMLEFSKDDMYEVSVFISFKMLHEHEYVPCVLFCFLMLMA